MRMPSKRGTMIHQYRVSLRNISPIIWRGIQVPESYTFWDLHVAIQDSMGGSTTIFTPSDFQRLMENARWKLEFRTKRATIQSCLAGR